MAPAKTSMPSNHPVAIVVTYNRKEILIECIRAVLSQSIPCDVLIVDNASTDDTKGYLQKHKIVDNPNVYYLHLSNNTGGAGGFYHGVRFCMASHWDWFWLMDDDAKPEPDALENLLLNARDRMAIYGSVAVGIENQKQQLCWPVNLSGKSKKYIEWYDDLQDIEEVSSIPFLGFFIHHDMVRKMGLPVKNYFIYSDDLEYCLRAKSYGAKIFLIKKSVIIHPLTKGRIYKFMNFKIGYRSFSSFKSYYEVRNKILTAKKYYGARLWTQTLPGIIFRALVGIFKEKSPSHVLATYTKAIVDGLSGTSGKTILPPE
ncbi:glycosyltransferase [Thermodesulfobacteriota bacterium]